MPSFPNGPPGPRRMGFDRAFPDFFLGISTYKDHESRFVFDDRDGFQVTRVDPGRSLEAHRRTRVSLQSGRGQLRPDRSPVLA
jgi:hypothetical protein